MKLPVRTTINEQIVEASVKPTLLEFLCDERNLCGPWRAVARGSALVYRF
jgi:ABC-type transporter MlaC component